VRSLGRSGLKQESLGPKLRHVRPKLGPKLELTQVGSNLAQVDSKFKLSPCCADVGSKVKCSIVRFLAVCNFRTFENASPLSEAICMPWCIEHIIGYKVTTIRHPRCGPSLWGENLPPPQHCSSLRVLRCAILRSHYLARQMNLKLVVAETNLCRRLLGATSEGLTLGTSCCDHELTRSQDGKIGSKDGCNNHGEVSNQDDKRS
jgi:hypothetical protein